METGVPDLTDLPLDEMWGPNDGWGALGLGGYGFDAEEVKGGGGLGLPEWAGDESSDEDGFFMPMGPLLTTAAAAAAAASSLPARELRSGTRLLPPPPPNAPPLLCHASESLGSSYDGSFGSSESPAPRARGAGRRGDPESLQRAKQRAESYERKKTRAKACRRVLKERFDTLLRTLGDPNLRRADKCGMLTRAIDTIGAVKRQLADSNAAANTTPRW
jgi:hypothetical protein